MHITHQCLIKHIGSPLPTNWLLNFPHGHNIKTHSPAPSVFSSPSPSVSWVHFVIGSTFDPRSKRTRLRDIKLFSDLVFSDFSVNLLAAISNHSNLAVRIFNDIYFQNVPPLWDLRPSLSRFRAGRARNMNAGASY